MFKEIETVIVDLDRKANSIIDLESEFIEWLRHPVTIAMFADLKRMYLLNVDHDEAREQRFVLQEIINKWGELPNED